MKDKQFLNNYFFIIILLFFICFINFYCYSIFFKLKATICIRPKYPKIGYNKLIKFEKPTVYMDIDDVLLDSTNAVLKVLYKRYGVQQEQVNIKDWKFRSAKRDMTTEQIEEIFESDDFWGCVELNKILVRAFEDGLWDNYNWVFVTKGTRKSPKEI